MYLMLIECTIKVVLSFNMCSIFAVVFRETTYFYSVSTSLFFKKIDTSADKHKFIYNPGEILRVSIFYVLLFITNANVHHESSRT